MSRRFLPCSMLAIATVAIVAGGACKPWTVRPIEETARDRPSQPGHFDATSFIDSIWTTRVIPAVKASAIVLTAELVSTTGSVSAAGPVGSTVLVRGAGVISRVDRRSRVGLALVDLAPGDGRPDVALQIGPVLRGTALRDALPFVRFGDFANQLEFADVANALNARVLQSVLKGLEGASLEGRAVLFWGATKLDGGAGERLQEVVPVIIESGTR